MNSSQQISVAKDFISRHKTSDPSDWFLQCQSQDTDKQYLEIYAKLEGGVFGECTDNSEWDEDEITKPATEFEVEISGFHSKTGNPIIFDWEDNQ